MTPFKPYYDLFTDRFVSDESAETANREAAREILSRPPLPDYPDDEDLFVGE